MAVPKHRKSRSKARMHRAHQRLETITVSECSHCHEPKLPHRVCSHCGYYKGNKIIEVEKGEE